MRYRFQQMFVRQRTILPLVLFAAFLAPQSAQAWTFKKVHEFCRLRFCADGYRPEARPFLAPDGNLYGITTAARSDLDLPGSVYQLTFDPIKLTWKLHTLYTFCKDGSPCSDGAYPIAGVIADTAGNLYGTASAGGARDGGVVFELSPGTHPHRWTLQVLYSFCSIGDCSDGQVPSSTLTYQGASARQPYDGASPLYGVTEDGGKNDRGTVYQLTPNGSGWTETVLYSFCSKSNCTDGNLPYGAVVLDGSGNIFGSTDVGGKQNKGVAFELSQSGGTWNEIILHDFCSEKNCRDGAIPGELTMDAGGTLFGATYSGGTAHKGCCGTIFKLVPNGAQSAYDVLYNFCSRRDCRDGATPTAPLSLDSSGNIFGTTGSGGGNDQEEGHGGGGTVFELSASGLQVLYSFCARHNCGDGENPESGVTIDASGNLIGATVRGGSDGGTVFEVSP